MQEDIILLYIVMDDTSTTMGGMGGWVPQQHR